jgi:dihydroorotate dehydrogenase electron transfer subunit
MRYVDATLVENRPVAPGTYVLTLGDCQDLAATLPGQFVMLRGQWGTDPLLPRAFSILAVRSGGVAELLCKTVGKATALLERAQPGVRLHLLGPLGNWFPAPSPDRTDWLIAGGVGLAPLLMQAHRARAVGAASSTTMFYGGRSAADLVLVDQIEATGVRLVLATEDGSRGHRGYVTGAVEAALEDRGAAADRPPTVLACGPDPMLQAVASLAHARGLAGYLSLEGEMACGIGACLACAVPCQSRPYRYACKDGPVFALDELSGVYSPTQGGAL